mgnify:CR=1 FL=1
MTPLTYKSTPSSPLALRPSLQIIGLALLVTIVGYGGVFLGLWLVPVFRAHAFSILAWSTPVLSLALIAAVGWVLRRHAVSWQSLGFQRPTTRLFHLLWQIPVMFIVLLVAQGLVVLVTQTDPKPAGGGIESLFGAISPLAVGAFVIGIGVLAPFWEEVVFRGVIYGGLRRKFSVFSSLLLAGVIFAVAHGYPILLPYMLTLGVSLALLYQFHRTLWASFIAHAVLNCFVTGLTLATVFAK